MTELKPICATLHPNMKSPCDGAIFVYAKDDVDKFIAEQNETHAVHEKYLTDAFNIREQALQDRLKKAETGVVHSPYITPTFLNRKSPNAIPIYVDLVDGTTLPGTFVCLAQARLLVETIDDGLTRQVPQTTWTLSILSDTLGSLDVDDLLQYDVDDLQEALDRSAPKPKPKPRRHAEYAHPFSCEGTGQWED